MTALQTYLAALAPGIDIVAGCAGMSEDQLRAAGAPNKTARTLLTLADALPLHQSSLGSTTKVNAWSPVPFPDDTVNAAQITVSYLDDGQLIDSLVSRAHESTRTSQEES